MRVVQVRRGPTHGRSGPEADCHDRLLSRHSGCGRSQNGILEVGRSSSGNGFDHERGRRAPPRNTVLFVVCQDDARNALKTSTPAMTRQTTKGSTVTKGQFLAYLALGPLLLFVSAPSGCTFIAPYTKDRLAFDAEVRSWGLLGLTEQHAKEALLAHGMQDAVRVYPCTQSVRPASPDAQF